MIFFIYYYLLFSIQKLNLFLFIFHLFIFYIYIIIYSVESTKDTTRIMDRKKLCIVATVKKNGQKGPLKCKMGVIFRHFRYQSLLQE